VAVDRSGDVFIAHSVDNQVLVDRPNGSGGYTQDGLAGADGIPQTALNNPPGLASPALPTGKTLYAKIVAKISGSWTDYQAISFTAAANPVAFTHPTQRQTQVGTPAAFSWSTTPAATGYQMWIGTRPGDGSLLKSGWLRPSTSSYPVPALPAGQTLYARIYRGRERLGQPPGHHLHHRRVAGSDRQPRAHRPTECNRRRPTHPSLDATTAATRTGPSLIHSSLRSGGGALLGWAPTQSGLGEGGRPIRGLVRCADVGAGWHDRVDAVEDVV
jgi:hypothetical protein